MNYQKAIQKNKYFQIIIYSLLFIAFSYSYSHAEIIPTDRRINWSPGIPGGIPTYTTTRNAQTQHGAVGDGIADDTAAIQACINALTANQVCLLPAGIYKVTSQLNMAANNTVLKGVGADSKIISYGTAGHIINIGSGSEGNLINISSGYVKDSTSLTFADAAAISSIAVGDYIVIAQSNDALVERVGNNGTCTWCGLNNDSTKAMNQVVRVTDKVDNVLTIHRPLYYTFQASLTPQIIEFGMKTNIGIEDLYIENNVSTLNNLSANIQVAKCAYCWVKNVGSYNANRSHVKISEAYGAEIRDSKFTYGHSYGGDHAYGVFIFVTNSDHLVENNIFYHLRHSMVMEGGGSGNVFGYNYSELMWDQNEDQTDWLMGDMLSHGAHSYMNLFEGNIANRISSDFVWGSSSHNTYLRNYADTQSAGAVYALRAVEVMKYNTYLNFVGNVFGYAGMYTAYENGLGTGANTRTSTNDFIYTFGYSGDSDTTSDDQSPYDTALRHGNYDYHNNNTVWDSGIADRNIPNSYYLASKPSFFGSKLWPLFGSDVGIIAGALPAEERFNAPAQDTATPSIPANLSAAVISSSQINLSWTVSTDNIGVTGYKIYRNSAQVATSTNASYSDTGLIASTSYTYTISAYDAAGNNSSQSSSVSAITQAPPDTTPPAISNISSISNTNSATISFALSETATSYIEYGLTTSYGATTSTTTASSITISNLNPNTTYNFRITSKDLSNNQTTSQNYTFITQQVADTTSPSTITNLAISNIGQTSLTLTWAAPSDASGVSNYNIRYSTSPISEANFSQATQVSSIPTPAQEGLEQQIYISVGLTPSATYYFAIKSTDSVGNVSSISNTPQAITLSAPSTTSPTPSTDPGTVSVPVTSSTGTGGSGGGYTVYQTSDTISPNPPSDTIITSTVNQIIISWTNPKDSDFVRVKILRKTTDYPSSPTDGMLIYEGNKTTLTDTKLQNDQTYYYTLYSYDGIPNYSTPVKLQATPKASVTQTIQTPTLGGSTSRSIEEGSLIRGPDKIKVYIVNAFGFKRHIFNPAIFNMYGHFKWNEIKDVDQTTIDSYKTSDFYRADKDPRVFSLKEIDERQGKAEKRWLNIQGERFTTLGYKWEQVFIINEKERDYYQEGTPIGEQELQEKAIQTIKTIQPYSLVKTENSPTIYFITKQGIKKPILNEQVFNSYPQNNWNNIITTTEETLKQYPTATTVKLQGDEKIYIIDFQNRTKKWVRTLDAFNILGLSWDEVVEVNKVEFEAYAENGALE